MKKAKRRSSFRRKSRPRRQKTYEEIMAPKPNDLHTTDQFGIVIELYDTIENKVMTIGELVAKFYRVHLKQEAHEDRLNPVAFKLVEDPRSTVTDTKYWVAAMYAGFHVNIYRGPDTGGPHSAQLWYRSVYDHKRYPEWIATLQIMGFYFNEEEILNDLMRAIEEREFYISPTDKERGILP